MFRAILAFMIAFSLVGCGGGPDTTAKELMENLKDGKHLAVSELLNKDMKGLAVLMGGVSDRSLKMQYRKGIIKEFSIQKAESAGNSARYTVTVTAINGNQYKDFIDVVKEDGDWKVARF